MTPSIIEVSAFTSSAITEIIACSVKVFIFSSNFVLSPLGTNPVSPLIRASYEKQFQFCFFLILTHPDSFHMNVPRSRLKSTKVANADVRKRRNHVRRVKSFGKTNALAFAKMKRPKTLVTIVQDGFGMRIAANACANANKTDTFTILAIVFPYQQNRP